MTNMTEEKRKHHARIVQRRKWRKRIRIAVYSGIFCLFCLLIVKAIDVFQKPADISLNVKNLEVLQNQEMPQLKAEVKLSNNVNRVLDRKTKYTAKQLAKDLEDAKGYSLSCSANVATEGKYKIKLTLEKSLREKIEKKWKKRLRFTTEDGILEVKNPVGEWDGTRFKKYDGSYVKKDFVVSKAKTYYFDGDGKLVTGLQKIKDQHYLFNSKGVMVTSKWETIDNKKYYFGKDGAAQTGLVEKKKGTYYFDDNGVMQTGEVKLGFTLYTFDENGLLVDKKDVGIDRNQPMVALTFDDGPGKRTNELLDAFEKYNAHGTFFMLGQHVSQYADVVKRMKAIGCELGNHSWNHAQLTKLSADGIQSQVDRTDEKIKAASGAVSTVMRPPYGAVNDTVRATVKEPLIFWSIDTLDWKTRNAQKTIDTVMSHVKDGDIILMHDIHPESVDAALQLIPRLKEEGYQLVTVSELAEAKGVQMEDGAKYFEFN